MFKIKVIFIGIHSYSLEFINGFLTNFSEGLILKFKGHRFSKSSSKFHHRCRIVASLIKLTKKIIIVFDRKYFL